MECKSNHSINHSFCNLFVMQWCQSKTNNFIALSLFFQDYIFALLNGYHEPPAGVSIAEEQHYNVYFPGQAIGMAQALYNEIIEYEDGKFVCFQKVRFFQSRVSFLIKLMFFGNIFWVFCASKCLRVTTFLFYSRVKVIS